MTAISSGSILHVPTLRRMLPLPAGLWLDYVDHWIFAQLQRGGLQAAVLDQVVQHDLAAASPRTLSRARLVSILEGEAIFHRLLGSIPRLVYPWRVAWRILRLAAINPPLAAQALKWVTSRGSASR